MQREPKGTRINITVSTGPKSTKVTVPSVVGDSKSAAISALKAAGFKVQVNTVTQAGAAANSVVNQTPAGNTPAPKGSTVTISVTGNSETVPSSILGMTQAQATTLLQAAPYNYQVTAIQEGSGNGSYPVGTVYAASPPVGQSAGAWLGDHDLYRGAGEHLAQSDADRPPRRHQRRRLRPESRLARRQPRPA